LELLRSPARAASDRVSFAMQHFGRLVEHLEQPLVLWTEGGSMRIANPAFARLLGRPVDEVVQLDIAAVADALAALTDDADFVAQFRNRPGQPALFNEEVVLAGESPRIWRWSSKPIDLPDGVGALDTWLDITAERELARAALTDSLTGLANRRGAEASCRRELARATRQGTPVSFLVVDIDHFKRVNDAHGHAVGDAVIRAVGALLVRALRGSDVAARWGGEEFLAVLPDATTPSARMIAERFRASLEAETILPGLRVTASVGTAQWDPGERAETAIGRADAALYEAKAAGRNCVR
jgi:diguanylate cyclase (GGDEF)-like protein